MSEPMQVCYTCQRTRRCYDHSGAEFPPDAAKRWLRRHCPANRQDCDIHYRAGWLFGGPPVGQADNSGDPLIGWLRRRANKEAAAVSSVATEEETADE